MVLYEQKKIGKIEKDGKKEGCYRKIDQELDEMDWQSADPKNFLDVRFPFGLEKYMKLHPGSLCMVAGSKNAGKTSFLFEFIIKNMYNPMGLDFLNSETGEEAMHERFDYYPEEIPKPAPFRSCRRFDNFADIVRPNRITVIDYLDRNSEVYEIGEELEQIYRKLGKGMALIAIQKKPGQDLGQGGVYTWKKAALYLALDKGRLKIVTAKRPADPKVNPENMQWSFWIDDKTAFRDIKRVQAPGEWIE